MYPWLKKRTCWKTKKSKSQFCTQKILFLRHTALRYVFWAFSTLKLIMTMISHWFQKHHMEIKQISKNTAVIYLKHQNNMCNLLKASNEDIRSTLLTIINVNARGSFLKKILLIKKRQSKLKGWKINNYLLAVKTPFDDFL